MAASQPQKHPPSEYCGITTRWKMVIISMELCFVLILAAVHIGGFLLRQFSSGRQYILVVLPAAAVAYCAVMTPAIFHLTYALPHRFALDNRSRWAGLKASIKSVFARAMIGVIVIGTLTEAYDSTDPYWPLPLVFVLLVIALGRNLGIQNIKKSGISEITDADEAYKEKFQAINKLAETARIRNLHIGVIDMKDQGSEFFAACFTSGRKKVILISDTMMGALSEKELVVVAAHELAHIKRAHCGSAILGIAIRLGICVLLAYLLLPQLAPDHNDWRQLAGAWPVLLMTIWLCGLALMPVRMASSRRQERRANYEAVKMTNDPASFISAMAKLADTNLISGRPTWVEKALFQTHPTLDEIIRQARRFAADHDIELESQPPRTVSS